MRASLVSHVSRADCGSTDGAVSTVPAAQAVATDSVGTSRPWSPQEPASRPGSTGFGRYQQRGIAARLPQLRQARALTRQVPQLATGDQEIPRSRLWPGAGRRGWQARTRERGAVRSGWTGRPGGTSSRSHDCRAVCRAAISSEFPFAH